MNDAQSRNTSDVRNRKPSEVLTPESLQEYTDWLHRIHTELFRLNSNLFVLGKLLDFPVDLILGLRKNTFFTLIEVALTHDSILIATKLLTDDGGGKLRRLGNIVGKNIKPECQKSLGELLPNRDLNKATELTVQKMTYFRDNVIAHIGVDKQTGNLIILDTDLKVAMQDLLSIRDVMNKYFDVLCFGEPMSKSPIDYDPPIWPPGYDRIYSHNYEESDIEYVLRLVVQDSDFYKEPDEFGWSEMKSMYPKEHIEFLNKYRRISGKPEIQ